MISCFLIPILGKQYFAERNKPEVVLLGNLKDRLISFFCETVLWSFLFFCLPQVVLEHKLWSQVCLLVVLVGIARNSRKAPDLQLETLVQLCDKMQLKMCLDSLQKTFFRWILNRINKGPRWWQRLQNRALLLLKYMVCIFTLYTEIKTQSGDWEILVNNISRGVLVSLLKGKKYLRSEKDRCWKKCLS